MSVQTITVQCVDNNSSKLDSNGWTITVQMCKQ